MTPTPYHFELGDFKCIAIRDGGHMGSADVIFCNAPEKELTQALRRHNLEADSLESSWTCLLVDTGPKTLLIDTGVGSELSSGGNLVRQLEEAGYPPERIDLIFLTHGHPDHIGACTDAAGKLAFENARYLMAKTEYEFWTENENLPNLGDTMVRFARKKLPAIREHLQLLEGDEEVLPGVQAVKAFGHTPGHLCLEIRSQGQVLFNFADLVLHPLHLEYPEWYATVDIQPEQLVATRYHLLERASTRRAKVLIFHFDFPSIGYVVQDGESWRWRPVIE
jgi:glyoxylase-like metal-dependent hydrolase (beta-lactamase superfamily II)